MLAEWSKSQPVGSFHQVQTDFYCKQNMEPFVINVVFLFYFTWRLIVVDIYPLQLQVTVTLVAASGVDAMLITDHLPELRWGKKTVLIKAFDVDFVTHICSLFCITV